MNRGQENVIELLARNDPIGSEELERRLEPARLNAVLAAAMSAPPQPRPRVVVRRARVALPVLTAAVLAIAAAVLVTSLLTGGTQNALAIERTDEFVNLRIEDPGASAERMNRELRDRGIDIEVQLVPVLPREVGNWVGGRAVWPGVPEDADQHRLGDDRIRELNEAAGLREIVRVPNDPRLIRVRADFEGHVLLYGGREARPGEKPWIDGNPPGAR